MATFIIGRNVYDSIFSHGTFMPIENGSAEVRSNFRDGFIDGIELFDHFASTGMKAVNGTVNSDHTAIPFISFFELLTYES